MVEDDTDCAHDDTHTKQYARTHATCVFLPYSIKGTTYHTVDYYPYSSLGCMESCGPVWISPRTKSIAGDDGEEEDDARDGEEDEEVNVL